MNQETRSNWIIWGSIIAIIGFFLPQATDSTYGYSKSLNGSDLAMWPIFTCAVILLIIGLATRHNAEGFANIVQKFLHIGLALSTLLNFYNAVTSGQLTRSFQSNVFSYWVAWGNTYAGYYYASGAHVDLSYGFLVLVVGLVVSGIGTYAKAD